jgi:hypothetical protein
MNAENHNSLLLLFNKLSLSIRYTSLKFLNFKIDKILMCYNVSFKTQLFYLTYLYY